VPVTSAKRTPSGQMEQLPIEWIDVNLMPARKNILEKVGIGAVKILQCGFVSDSFIIIQQL